MLATKAHGRMHDTDPNQFGNSRRWLVKEVERSLKRLKTDWIDLYQIHRPEPDTDIDQTLGALSDLVAAGKVRAIGSSTFPAWQIVPGAMGAERRGRERFICEQPPYSMLIRAIERDVLPACEQYGMGVIPWSPLAGGWLSGRYTKGGESPGSSRRAQMLPSRYDMSIPGNQAKLEAAEKLAEVAEQAGMPLIEMSIRFVTSHRAVTAAIIGPRTMEQLESQLAALEQPVLPPDVLDRIDEIVPPGRTSTRPTRAGTRPGSPTLAAPPLSAHLLGHPAHGAQAPGQLHRRDRAVRLEPGARRGHLLHRRPARADRRV